MSYGAVVADLANSHSRNPTYIVHIFSIIYIPVEAYRVYAWEMLHILSLSPFNLFFFLMHLVIICIQRNIDRQHETLTAIKMFPLD